MSWLGRYSAFYAQSAVAVIVIMIMTGIGGSAANGGIEGFIAPILIVSPITAGLFLGPRATAYSAVGSIAALGSLIPLEMLGFVRTPPYSPEHLKIVSFVWLAVAVAIASAAVAYFAFDSEKKVVTLSEYQRKLYHAAHHDPLTGVANRQGLQTFIESELSKHESDDAQICVVHIDLDHFKTINDTHGHPTGDAVLRRAAHKMSQLCADRDLLARVGGDEFVAVRLFQGPAERTEVREFCKRIIKSVQEPISANGTVCSVGASIGYVISDIASCSVETLISNADYALYEAKRRGRGVAREFTPNLREQIAKKRYLSSEIENALEDGRVTCALQPQVCFETGELFGVESLGRIQATNGTLLLPAVFIPELEAIERLDQFDRIVAKVSIDAFVELRKSGFAVPNVSINASGSALRSSDYCTYLIDELQRRKLSPNCLTVEILETILIEDQEELAVKSIRALRRAGIRVVMDDFGSGHASIARLLQLDFDGLKVDRSLIEDIESERAQRVLGAILRLSSGLNLSAVVEGVETTQQNSILKGMGCQAAQRFGICKPMELDRLIEWLSAYGQSEVLSLQNRARSM